MREAAKRNGPKQLPESLRKGGNWRVRSKRRGRIATLSYDRSFGWDKDSPDLRAVVEPAGGEAHRVTVSLCKAHEPWQMPAFFGVLAAVLAIAALSGRGVVIGLIGFAVLGGASPFAKYRNDMMDEEEAFLFAQAMQDWTRWVPRCRSSSLSGESDLPVQDPRMSRSEFAILVLATATLYAATLIAVQRKFGLRASRVAATVLVAASAAASVLVHVNERANETPLQTRVLGIVCPTIVGAIIVQRLLRFERHWLIALGIGAVTCVITFYLTVAGAYFLWGPLL